MIIKWKINYLVGEEYQVEGVGLLVLLGVVEGAGLLVPQGEVEEGVGLPVPLEEVEGAGLRVPQGEVEEGVGLLVLLWEGKQKIKIPIQERETTPLHRQTYHLSAERCNLTLSHT